MRFVVKREPPGDIDVSLVLLDWGCRESFHLLDCLAGQTADRSRYEIIWVEFYDESPRLCELIEAAESAGGPPPLDIYAVVGMARNLYYHKHLMMNAGILLAHGRIVCFADSDALVRPTFIESIIQPFEQDPAIVLHLDEVRNNDRSFYPFNHPALEDITGVGCINWINGRPAGLLDRADPLHTRNYGACMAARREDLIAIGGSDMHIDYLGHIAGPYEMTWRLANAGNRVLWHPSEWLYHVWHPGQAGKHDITGPHDGMHISTRALQCLHSSRTRPFVENPAIAMLRQNPGPSDPAKLLEALVDPRWRRDWQFPRAQRVGSTSTLSASTIRRDGIGTGSNAAANPVTAPKPLFGYAFNKVAHIRDLPLLCRMFWHQLQVKRRAAAWSRPKAPGPATREWLRKCRATLRFIRTAYAFNKHRFRQCWRALAYAAQEGKTNLVLYGQGDAARILCALSRSLPVNISGICPISPQPPPCLRGRKTLTERDLPQMEATIVVASFVNTPAHLARLEELGIHRDAIITLE